MVCCIPGYLQGLVSLPSLGSLALLVSAEDSAVPSSGRGIKLFCFLDLSTTAYVALKSAMDKLQANKRNLGSETKLPGVSGVY